MRKLLLTAIALALAVPALAAQQDIAQISAVTASREALRTAVNTQLSAVQANFDEVYAVIDAGPVYVNASAPADTKVVWIDTDQNNAIKAYIGGAWTVVGTAGSAGDGLGSAAYSDVVALWTTCTGYLKSDGTCDTPSGSATYPSAAGVANWSGSAWGTSYTVGTAANNLVQLNASAQLPAVSADLLTITDTNSRFATDTVGAALVQIGEFNAALPSLVFGAGLTLTEDTPSAGTDTISVSANTYQAYDADWLGITPNGAALVSAANYAAMRTLLDLEAGIDFNAYDADIADLADGSLTGSKVSSASDTAVGVVELAIASEINTGTDTGRAVTPDALAGSNLGSKEIGWVIVKSDTVTAVADGKDAIAIPSSLNGMNLTDVTCSVAALNAASSGATTVVIRRVRLGSRMGDDTSQFDLTFSTPNVTVTWDATGTDPGISTSTLAAGDEVDISGFATAANNGHFTVATVGANYFTFANASGVENLNDTGVTITPIRHRDMTSTGVTIGYNEYTASDETVDTANDDVQTGDKIFADVNAVTTAVHKGLYCTAVFQLP